MKLGTAIAVLGGLALVIVLVAWQGAGTIAETLTVAGLQTLWLPVYYAAIPIALSAVSWRLLFPRAGAPGHGLAWRATWVGLAVNWLLPVAQIGGEVVKARLLVQARIPGALAFASVVVDKFIQAVTQLLFALAGVVLLLVHGGDDRVIAGTLGFVGLLALGLIGFYRAQLARPYALIARFAGRFAPALRGERVAGHGAGFDEALGEIYSRRRDVILSALWRLVFRLAVAVEVWLALDFLGNPITLMEAVILESIGQAIRGAAFMVPGGLGIQEGGFMILGAAVGLDPALGLALSLLKRVRELGVGLPGLLAWQLAEGRHLLGRRP
ncbi:MAG: flippase-like domain-containing protein [Alphaproteobacteria bacterium]|nr:flippase-like domain-containing protein [Alphaproteobacteria bacterium]